MRIAFFKKIASYFYPLLIKNFSSEHNGLLELSLQNGKLVVDSANANYSYGLLHNLFREVLAEFTLDRTVQEVLLLGFGAGSIAKILVEEKNLDLHISGVEIDPVMIEIYTEYFKTNSSAIQVYQEDALSFLKNTTNYYDLILIDVFEDTQVPKELLNIEFVELLKKHSKSTTGIAMNTMLSKEDAFVKLWMDSFGSAAYNKNYHLHNLVLFKKAGN